MEKTQVDQELRDLRDESERQQTCIDDLLMTVAVIQERKIPAAIAKLEHKQIGLMELLASVAGTTEKLAVQLRSITDRLTLLERMADDEAPPIRDSPKG